MTDRAVGASIYAQEINRGRNAAAAIRLSVERMEGCGPTTLLVLIAKIATNVAIVTEVFSNLENIGRDAKSERKLFKKDGG